MFIPYQSILIPLMQALSAVGLAGTMPGLIACHVIYGISITTLIFRNYYAAVPNELIEASRIMDELFWLQAYGEPGPLLAGLEDENLRRLAEINYGPWDRLAADQPFVESAGAKFPGAQFYPDDMSKEEFEEKRFEFHQELAEDFFATYRVEKVLTYSIKKGDNIWTLSRDEFEVPLWLIRRYNVNLDIHALVPAQKLLIPVIEKNA